MLIFILVLQHSLSFGPRVATALEQEYIHIPANALFLTYYTV